MPNANLNIDPKAAGGTLGAAVSGLGWFLAAKFGWGGIDEWDPAELATASGFSTVILAGLGAYLPRNAGSGPSSSKIPGGEPVEQGEA